MDRTYYGKMEPGEMQPYRTAVRLKGIAPACKYCNGLFLIKKETL